MFQVFVAFFNRVECELSDAVGVNTVEFRLEEYFRCVVATVVVDLNDSAIRQLV